MKNFNTLKKNLKKDFSVLKTLRIAILGDSATQFLTQAIKATGYEYDINLDIWESDFNQIERQILDASSELYTFNPEIILLFQSSHKLLGKYNKLKFEEQSFLAEEELNKIENLIFNINNKLSAKIIYYNYNEIDDSVFGSFANKLDFSFLFQIRKLNFELMQFSIKNTNLYICDLSSIQNQIGKEMFFQPSVYINTEMVLSIDVLPFIAYRTLDIISSFNGKINKCVVLDLDNTTWGGIIGDDGLENIQIGSLGIGKAFSEFQYWIKKLKNRGIIVTICSKNTQSIAEEPFLKHPDMVLKMDDISVFIANWENKADNIRQIQSVLNIGFDSMVFIDDNPFERNIVRENIPGIIVPEMPEDPAEYLEYLYSLNLFETISSSREDSERTKLYQIESKRKNTQHQFTNEDEFLESLNMTSRIEPFNQFNSPRVSQLSQRSNQFNLRTVRYTETDILNISNSNEFFTFTFTLDDKFGENGLICVIILKKVDSVTLFIDTWFMSCRVLKRGMENFVLNTIIDAAIENKFSILRGEFLSTSKNEMVKNHYSNLGFEDIGNGCWDLNINSYTKKKSLINIKNEYEQN